MRAPFLLATTQFTWYRKNRINFIPTALLSHYYRHESEGVQMSHVFLCTICGYKMGRLLTKGQCVICRNKALQMYPSESSPEFIKKYRQVNKLHSLTSPTQANILVTLMVSMMLALGWVAMTYFHDWDTTRSTIAMIPYGDRLLKVLPEGAPAAQTGQPGQIASQPSTIH
jgi:hypothetical protein